MWKFRGWPEFKEFMQLSYDFDMTLRSDRVKYIVDNQQEMLVETQDCTGGLTPERQQQVHVTSTSITRWGNRTVQLPK